MPTAQKTLRVHEVPGYTQTHPTLPNDKALLVDWDGTPFALLYVTSVTNTLAWEGIVAFDRLESEFVGALKALGWSDVSLRDPAWRKRILVALVFPGSNDSDELVKYRLNKPDEYAHYTQAMTASSSLAFARYDVTDSPGAGRPSFSFVAENATLRSGKDGEVALQLPRSQKWTETLLGWVIAHHQKAPALTGSVAPESAAAILNQHLGSP